MTLPERLIAIIKALNLKNSSFSKGLGVTHTTIDGYTKGRTKQGAVIFNKPNFDVLLKMYQVYNINIYYLFGVSDEMFVTNLKKSNSKVLQFVVDPENNDYDTIIDFMIENDSKFNSVKYRNFLDSRSLEVKRENMNNEIINSLEKLKKEFMKKK